MLHEVNAALTLTSGQQVLKVIATIKGDTLQTYMEDCVLNELWGELEVSELEFVTFEHKLVLCCIQVRKSLFYDVYAVEAGLALWTCRMNAHTVQTKVSCSQKLSFVTTVKTILAEPLRQTYNYQLILLQI